MPQPRTFMRKPKLDPDANLVERQMKGVAIMRINFLFFGSALEVAAVERF